MLILRYKKSPVKKTRKSVVLLNEFEKYEYKFIKINATENWMVCPIFINDVLNILHPSSGCNSGLQNLLKNIYIINTLNRNKAFITS